MRNGDVRRMCLALVHHHLGAAVAAADPPPVALGWHLECGRASLHAMTALCDDALADAPVAGPWQPSAALRAFLGEYGAIRLERRPSERAVAAPRGLRAVQTADVRR